MARLIVADKPSVARDLARVLGAKRREEACFKSQTHWITWSTDRLAELCEPGDYRPEWKAWSTDALPILPTTFKVRAADAQRSHFNAVVQLMNSAQIDTIINACDAGREGELVFRYLIQLAETDKPVLRLWLSSMTDRAIVHGLQNLVPSERYDALADAARCRSEADWLVGINATRALTLVGRAQGAFGELFSVGRVQTPTLAMLADREDEIERFEPRPFWTAEATFEADGARFVGRLLVNDAEILEDEQAANDARTLANGPATITRLRKRQERQRPPRLFDLTTLQRVANTKYGLTGQQTLDAAENLYETHKLITYPRSDTNYVTADMVPALPSCVRALAFGVYKGYADHLLAQLPLQINLDVVELLDLGEHHAIIPTGIQPNEVDLTDVEQKVYDLVVRRFLATFYPDALYDLEEVVVEAGALRFAASVKQRMEAGWHEVESPMKLHEEPSHLSPVPSRDPLGLPAPALHQGQEVRAVEVHVHEGMTQPPRRHTEASLLGAMQSAGRALDNPAERNAMMESGLGTPATRASVIERLLERGYIMRHGRTLSPTPCGRALVASIPVEELRSAQLTGQWEARLVEVAAGRLEPDAFRQEVREFTARIVPAILQNKDAELGTGESVDRPVLGTCPICATAVTEGLKAFSCQSGRACSFVIFKNIAQRDISPSLVTVLLTRGRTRPLRGFVSRKGQDFSAALVLSAEGKVEFNFDEIDADTDDADTQPHAPANRASALIAAPVMTARTRPPIPGLATAPSPPLRSAPAPRSEAAPSSRPATPCPNCRKGAVIRGRKGWGCSRWKDGCRFVVWFEQFGRGLPEAQAQKLFRVGATDTLAGFVAPDGRHVSARLVLDLDAPSWVRLEGGRPEPVVLPLQPELF